MIFSGVSKSKFVQTGMNLLKKMPPRAEVIEGRAVLREVKGQEPYYAVLRDLETHELVGMQEDNYMLLQKNGKFIETTTDIAISQPFYKYTAISDATTGKVEQLAEQKGALNSELILMENGKGNIVSKTKTDTDKLEEYLTDKDSAMASNKVIAYNNLMFPYGFSPIFYR